MKSPYIAALNRPAAGDDAPFMKNDTVIGTIGNTQGVSRAANPQRMASMTRAQLKPFFSPSALSPAGTISALSPARAISVFLSAWTASALSPGAPFTLTLNFQYSGEAHCVSVQDIHVTSPETVAEAPSTRIFCAITISSKNTGSPS